MKPFSLGLGTALGAIVVLNARVLLFAAGFERLKRDNPGMFDGSQALASIDVCATEYARQYGLDV